jgi:UDP-N-acetylglucosamine 2-epimerase (non-hydrolysing)
VLARHGLSRGGYGLVTLHRPANVDDPEILTALLKALGEVADRCPLLLPVHPRAAGRLAELGVPGGVRLIPPAGYLDFIALQDSARVVLTDSGGVQEETTALGVPCVTLRDNTERPITVDQGTNVLAGRDPERIVRTVNRVLDSPPAPRRPELWDGHAGDRIAEVLLTGGTAGSRLRPTDLPDKGADGGFGDERVLS